MSTITQRRNASHRQLLRHFVPSCPLSVSFLFALAAASAQGELNEVKPSLFRFAKVFRRRPNE
jgi:hypothetical protein